MDDAKLQDRANQGGKRRIGRSTTPRWELDLIAYKGSSNEVLAVECKSFLDSTGVIFKSGGFEPPARYKLFTEPVTRHVVLSRLEQQLLETGACAASPRVTLCMAVGKIASRSSGLRQHFDAQGWRLFDVEWIKKQLLAASERGYENDVAFVVSKILLREHKQANDIPTPKEAS